MLASVTRTWLVCQFKRSDPFPFYRAQLSIATQATEVKDQAEQKSTKLAEIERKIDHKDPIVVLLDSLVKIPAGEFMMGSEEKDPEAHESEFPQHRVTLKAFELGAMPVTQAQYEAVMGSNPSYFQGPKNWNNPVEQVSWEDAKVFCQKLSEKTGRTFMLPNEAQWEYACRAGSSWGYCFGYEEELKDYAWYDRNSGKQTYPVGTLKPNAWGLYDTHGNVWEWCEDSWHKNYEDVPADGSAWVDEGRSNRVIRGGSWLNSARSCRSAYRSWDAPGSRNYLIGFRVLAVPKPGMESR